MKKDDKRKKVHDHNLDCIGNSFLWRGEDEFHKIPKQFYNLTKREFLKLCGTGFCAFCTAQLFGLPKTLQAQMAVKGLIKTRLSPYFTPLDGGDIRCELCPRRCRVPAGKRGFCRVRENRDGRLYSLVYGNPCAIHLDPIEKEPFFHVLPGTTSLTLSTAGCNLECKFCENWEISQAAPEDVYGYDIPPEVMVSKAKEMGARSIAYTYAEPTIYYEYMSDIASLAKKEGLLNVIHSNGFINEAPLRNLCKVLDAAQIDLKGFTETFYSELSNGKLDPVLKTLKVLRQEKIHLEITNLVIPTKNDEMSVVKEMCLWIKRELGSDIPVHFSRFYPLHKLQRLPSTPIAMLEEARNVALSCGLEYVYIGKVPGHEGWNTFCPKCKRIIIQRIGYMIKEIHLKEGKCEYCGRPIPGIWG
ncbi:MAG: AmmeMemoRadiSam system radical SAM enzyme [Deltaproteobacteria bacterium]|nr:AmmeMemoRadiSam system radical SAM enzyme [Deltaproteobacteria bacterium]MBW2616497.1 AmmeMemoRadiSam system radical SAM enzyme [Deltaproteobacteria bacterium]